ncbi:MAG: fumarate hydratase [Candidatus Gracilibacteria bacterium]|nr:fumarate hydratase [Candidatus Gracilibacteria bacterium]
MLKISQSDLVELIRKTSCELPQDVLKTLQAAHRRETAKRAKFVLEQILRNLRMAEKIEQPICQDTGVIHTYVYHPKDLDLEKFRKLFLGAVKKATQKGYLRPNSVDSLTSANSNTNIGPGTGKFEFKTWNKPYVDIVIMLKGSGSENVSRQYKLPSASLQADRDLAGVERCILDALVHAQGRGCSPGFLGVCIGGDREKGYRVSKRQFLRKVQDKNKIKELAKLEDQILKKANQLNIGPMGLGGKTTLSGVKITAINRHPGSYFVTISYMCWAYRRQGARFDKDGKFMKWIY